MEDLRGIDDDRLLAMIVMEIEKAVPDRHVFKEMAMRFEKIKKVNNRLHLLNSELEHKNLILKDTMDNMTRVDLKKFTDWMVDRFLEEQ